MSINTNHADLYSKASPLPTGEGHWNPSARKSGRYGGPTSPVMARSNARGHCNAASLLLVLGFILGGVSEAALHDRGGGMIYDDVLDITWLQDANFPKTSGYSIDGRMTWDEAVAWADQLVYGGYDDWRLASISVAAGLPTGVQPIVLHCDESEVQCRDNEIAYMYYWNLLGTSGENKSGNQTTGNGVQLFNIQRTYWTGTEFRFKNDIEKDPNAQATRAWTFSFSNGIRNPNDKYLNFSAWAVRPGDAGNSVAAPQIDSLTATPNSILDTESTQLAVEAVDPAPGPESLTYRWSIASGGGTIDEAASASPVYTPPDITGTQTVWLRVEISDGAAVVIGNLSLQVTDANPAPPSVELLTADFSASALNGWSVRDEGTASAPSRWGVVAGELAQLANIYAGSTSASELSKPGTYLAYDDGAGWGDYRLKFKLRSTDDDTLGVMFRVRDNDNYYRLAWNKQLGYRRLEKKASGSFSVLAADNAPYVQGRTYHVEIVAQGSQLEVWIDGTRVFQATDAAHSHGTLAFYTWMNTGAYFDDLTVNSMD